MPSLQLNCRTRRSHPLFWAIVASVVFLFLLPSPARAASSTTYRAALPIVSGPSTAPPPTTFALIDATVTAGTITSETGLLYKVYNTFADPRLPAQYRGDDSKVTDSHALTYAIQRWDSLSSSTREALRPFMTPPVFDGSWYDLRYGSTGSGSAPADAFAMDTYPICGSANRDKWSYDTGRVAYVKIWWPKADLAAADIARAYLNEMDSTIWPKLTGLMGIPLTDGACPCGGDDDRLDIYLSPIGRSFEMPLSPPGCKRTPAYIVLRPNAPMSTLAHELMHAIQDSYNTANSCVYAGDYAWLCEATAEWSQNYVYPSENSEHSTADHFLTNPGLRLDLKNDAHEYGAYLFPFYIAGTQGAPVIRTIWNNTTSNSGLDAIDKAVQGGFSEVWPRFIAYNWNRAPYDYYKQWDGLTRSAKQETTDVTLDAAGFKDYAAGPSELWALTASYYHFKFTDDNVRSVGFYNGWTFKVSKKELELGYGHVYGTDPVTDDQKKGASVQAYIKINGEWRKEDWKDKESVFFCRDKKAERIEELVVIYGNSAHTPAGNVLTPRGERPRLVVSNVGCYQWEGSVTMAAAFCPGDVWSVTASNLLFEKSSLGDRPEFLIYDLKQGTLTWNISPGSCSSCQDTHGGGSFALVPVNGAAFLTSPNLVLDGTVFRRLAGSGTDLSALTWTACGDSVTIALPSPWAAMHAEGELLKADGTLDVVYNAGGANDPSYVWKLTPKRED